jgi:hypothetical protein
MTIISCPWPVPRTPIDSIYCAARPRSYRGRRRRSAVKHMPAEIETMAFAGVTPWRGLGTPLTNDGLYDWTSGWQGQSAAESVAPFAPLRLCYLDLAHLEKLPTCGQHVLHRATTKRSPIASSRSWATPTSWTSATAIRRSANLADNS